MPKIQEYGPKHNLYCTVPIKIARVKGWAKGTELFWGLDPKTGMVFVEEEERVKEVGKKRK